MQMKQSSRLIIYFYQNKNIIQFQSDVLFDILSIDWSFYNFKVNIILQKKKSPNNQIYLMRLWLIYIVESFWQQIIFRFYFKAKFLFE